MYLKAVRRPGSEGSRPNKELLIIRRPTIMHYVRAFPSVFSKRTMATQSKAHHHAHRRPALLAQHPPDFYDLAALILTSRYFYDI
jgi:hypothetical protein